jgi:uncharacterized membrane protein YdbT with pleckstrin-like domain
MSYVQKVLQPGEMVMAMGRMHWIVTVRGLALALAGLVVIFWPPPSPDVRLVLQVIGALLVILGLVDLARALFVQWTTEIAVTNKRVIHKRGFIRRDTAEMNMDKVESVTVGQSLLGRLLGYGTVTVRGTGAGLEGLPYIAEPLKLRSAIVVH